MSVTYDKILGELREKDSGGGALPPATTTTLGGIKVGAGLAVALDGLLSAALPTMTKETITTSQTWTAPADGVAVIILVGGGGRGAPSRSTAGGIQAGAGGGGGGISIAHLALAEGDQITLSIGAGGGGLTPDGNKTAATLNGAASPFVEAGGGKGGGYYSGYSGACLGGTGNLCNGGQGASGAVTGTADLNVGGGPGGWPNGGQGAGRNVVTGEDMPAVPNGGDGYAIIFYAARPAAQ